MKIVRENINFERGSEDPFRSLDIGQYAKIRKELEEDPEISVQDSINTLKILSEYFLEGALQKILNKYRKDPFHMPKIDFIRDILYDMSHNNHQISEREFLDWVLKFTETIDWDPLALVNNINGILYAYQME